MKLRILHKGLLFIFLPLLLQLVFFSQLFSLVNQVEKLEQEEERRILFVESSNQIIMEFGTSWTAIICRLFGSNAYKQDPEAYRARMEKVFTPIKKYAEEYPSLNALVEETERAGQEHYEIYKELQAAAGTPNSNSSVMIFNLLKMRPKFIQLTTRSLELKKMLEQETNALQETWKKNESRRVSLKRQILIGVIADFIITLILLTVFLLDISRRLKVLVANAALLPKGERLPRQVSGNDELAMLDAVLHDASSELESAKEHRKSLMEMVAHDLRSPLSSAKATVELLLGSSANGSADQSREHLGRLRRNLAQLIAFVEDLLTIEKLESGKLELDLSAFKIGSLIDDCLETLAVKAKARGIKLVREGADIEVVGDQARLTQVVMNLLVNAIKHSPDGGTVRVLAVQNDDTFKLSVFDQGKGIEAADQEKLFQKFVQAKDAKQKEGFGLGLAICKMIIDAHKGSIGLSSEAGKGAEFWFSLPNSDD